VQYAESYAAVQVQAAGHEGERDDKRWLEQDSLEFVSTMGQALAGSVEERYVEELRELLRTYGAGGLVAASTATPITAENIGRLMLRKMGWQDGAGLGARGDGITQPVELKGGKRRAADKTCIGWQAAGGEGEGEGGHRAASAHVT
jgi:hypothetical protein